MENIDLGENPSQEAKFDKNCGLSPTNEEIFHLVYAEHTNTNGLLFTWYIVLRKEVFHIVLRIVVTILIIKLLKK